MKLQGNVAIVSGGGQGIGRGIVLCLAEEGADVAILDIKRNTANKVSDEVKALGCKSLAVVVDATDSKQVSIAVQEVINTFGKINILVNNVGGGGETVWTRDSWSFISQRESEWDEAYAMNIKSHVLMCQAVVPYFLKQKSGKIVNIASAAGKDPSNVFMQYSVTKAGTIHFTRSLALELADQNINVNCVCPGLIYTPLWEKLAVQNIKFSPKAQGMTPKEYFLKFVAYRVPQKREQTPEDVGRAVVFLASEDARSITGQALNVDGGMVMY
jgi:meso-butanediol dehydrogenase/(S,S)-butanediol dehydrogenase/diacetyl reductase